MYTCVNVHYVLQIKYRFDTDMVQNFKYKSQNLCKNYANAVKVWVFFRSY